MPKRTTNKKTDPLNKEPRAPRPRRGPKMHPPLWYLAYSLMDQLGVHRSGQAIEDSARFLVAHGCPPNLLHEFAKQVNHLIDALGGKACGPLPDNHEPIFEDVSGMEPACCLCPSCVARVEAERARMN